MFSPRPEDNSPVMHQSIRAIGIWISLILLPSWGQAQVRPEAAEVTIEKKLIEGKKYVLLGDWEKAEAVYKAILDEDVTNSAACYELSRTLLTTNRKAEALDYIRRAIRIESDNVWYHLMEADIHEKTGDLYSAMKVYDRLISMRPDQPHFYEMQINLCQKTGETDKLFATLDQYQSLVGVTESMAQLRFETNDGLGRTREALDALMELVNVYPYNIEYKFLAAAYARKILLEDIAVELYRSILKEDPENSRAKLALAGTEKEEGNTPDYLASIEPVIRNPAVSIDVKLEELVPYVVQFSDKPDPALGQALLAISTQLVEAHPTEAKAFAFDGDIHALMGHKDEAIASYLNSTRRQDNIYVVWEQLLALMMADYRYAELVQQAEIAIDIFPNQAFLYYAAGFGAYHTSDYTTALDHLDQAMLMTGKNAHHRINVLNMLGMVYDAQGQMDKSVEAFETSLALNPKNPETLAYYSFSLSRRIVQSQRAVDMADKMMELKPPSAYLHRLAAEVYHKQNLPVKAVQAIDIAVKEDLDPKGYYLAGEIYLKANRLEDAVKMWETAVQEGLADQDLVKRIETYKSQ